ncbi:MAG: acyl-CoA dehydrogenase family protein [Chloroflexi bacterium]|nr:acyl-CoA dehydrogenase family protein [Chloroflexota bacterium]
MEFQFSNEDQAFRGELRDFIEQERLPQWGRNDSGSDDASWELTKQMRQKLAGRGWLTMHWPEEYGGTSASPVRTAIFNEEMSYHRVPGRDNFGVRMMGATLMIHGTDEQKLAHLPSVARGEVQWCQGYSEPESGSDLASLSTRAVRDGDDFVINGTKIWTSMAHRADWMMVLARSDVDAPKHRGISFFLVDMKTPGVQVKPIINMAGRHEFNEVLFDNVRVPATNIVGEENRGWYVAVTLLDFERSGIDYSANARRLLDDVRQYATETRRNGESLMTIPWVRSALADRYIDCEVARLIAYNVAYMQGEGLVPNKEASASKVFGSEAAQRVSKTCMEILGLHGALGLDEKWAPLEGRIQESWMLNISGTIAAGTSEIQRNVIASRGLGLPRG